MNQVKFAHKLPDPTSHLARRSLAFMLVVQSQAHKQLPFHAFGIMEVIAVGGRKANQFCAALSELAAQDTHRVAETIRIAVLVAQAEKGDLLAAEVQLVEVQELFVPVVLQLADIPGGAAN